MLVKDGNGTLVATPLFDTEFSASLGGFVPAATAAQLIVIQGAAGVVGKLKYISIGGDSGAATFNLLTVKLERWSTAGTPNTAVLTAVPTQGRHLPPTAQGATPVSAAPSLTVSSVGTAAYQTPGTVTGLIRNARCATPTTTFVAGAYLLDRLIEFKWTDKGDMAPMVVGTGDYLVLTATAVVATARLDINIQWAESTLG
jgi:hypothetical protein